MRVLAKLDSGTVARYRSPMNAPPRQDKFRAYRERKKALGLRQIRKWVVDTRTPEFLAEARRQAALADQGDDARDAATMMEELTREAWHDGTWR